MKKRYIFVITTISVVVLSLYLFFAIKYSDMYTNLFSAISCIISCIATVSLGIIAVWQTFQYKSIEDNRNYLPNLLIFCFDTSRKQEKLLFKANLSNKTTKINVLINIPNGTIYRLYLKSTKIYNNDILINSVENTNKIISFMPGVYDNVIRQQDTLDAAIMIDEQYAKNQNFYFDLEFEYYNIEGKLITKVLRMKYMIETYVFETIKKASYLK